MCLDEIRALGPYRSSALKSFGIYQVLPTLVLPILSSTSLFLATCGQSILVIIILK
jgi:hypothetical protein